MYYINTQIYDPILVPCVGIFIFSKLMITPDLQLCVTLKKGSITWSWNRVHSRDSEHTMFPQGVLGYRLLPWSLKPLFYIWLTFNRKRSTFRNRRERNFSFCQCFVQAGFAVFLNKTCPCPTWFNCIKWVCDTGTFKLAVKTRQNF